MVAPSAAFDTLMLFSEEARSSYLDFDAPLAAFQHPPGDYHGVSSLLQLELNPTDNSFAQHRFDVFFLVGDT